MPKTVADLRRSYRRYGIRCSANAPFMPPAHTDGRKAGSDGRFPFFSYICQRKAPEMHCTSHMGKRLLLLLLSIGCCLAGFAAESYTLRGRVIDRLTRRPVAYAAVVLDGQGDKGASTDSTGRFAIERVRPGIYRLAASCIGYRNTLTPEYVVSAATPFIEIELVEDAAQLDAVTVTPTPFRRTAESPVGLQVIGLREIEKSPGANRDVSRIVRSYPGVSFSPVGYRNDLIVRGGGPSENVFYMDGIEIPNINHFATQGASGGPVSIVNADLVREISFYTGAFPADRAGALSSVLDFRLRDGDPEKHSFKATLGASEVSLSGNGPLSERTTYLFSVRQSYLQLLFKMLGLPFLPNYIDAQIKIKSKLSARDELTVLGLTGIDNMRLNTDEKGEEAEYLLSYLPRIRQETFTVGAVYRHYAGQHTQSVSLSHNYLNNRNLKYRDNDASSDENLMLRLRSVEQKTTLRGENRSWLGRWTLTEGVELNYRRYTNRTLQRLYGRETDFSDYDTRLGIAGWGLFFTAAYESSDKRFTASAGLRADGCDYSARMRQFWRQLSPRLSLAYALGDALPQRVPQRPGPLRPLGLGQPLRGQPERHLRSAPLVERRSAPELDRRSALYPLRRGKVVARLGLGCAGAPLLRLRTLQYGAARGLRAARPAHRQDLLFPPLHAGPLRRPAKRHGKPARTPRRTDVDGRHSQPRGPRRRTALPHEIHRPVERDADPDARRDRRILIPQP